MLAGLVADKHILDIVSIAGLIVSVLGVLYVAYDVVGNQGLRYLTQLCSFAVAGALSVGPLYFRIFAQPYERTHPLWTGPLYAGLLLGATAGAAGGFAPMVARTLAQGRYVFEQYREQARASVRHMHERRDQTEQRLATAKARISAQREECARLKQAVATQHEAMRRTRAGSRRARKRTANATHALVDKEKHLRRAERALAEYEGLIAEIEARVENGQAYIVEAEAALSELEQSRIGDEGLDGTLRGLPLTKLEYGRYVLAFMGVGFLAAFVLAFVKTQQLTNALEQGVFFALFNAVLFGIVTRLYAGAARIAGPRLLASTSIGRRPRVFSWMSALVGATLTLGPAFAWVPLFMYGNHPIFALLDAIAGGTAGGFSLSITLWADRLSRRAYGAIGLGFEIIGVVVLANQQILELLGVTIR